MSAGAAQPFKVTRTGSSSPNAAWASLRHAMRRVERLISAAEYSEWMMIDFRSDFWIGGEEIVSTSHLTGIAACQK
jgi:hypothetical protein